MDKNYFQIGEDVRTVYTVRQVQSLHLLQILEEKRKLISTYFIDYM